MRCLFIADLLLLLFATAIAQRPLVGFAGVLAASATGAIIGLLFAFPKRVAAVEPGTAGESRQSPRAAIVANTSLEEVSDWLTKTIIGVGLVSWPALLARLDWSGNLIGAAIFGSDAAALPGGVAILVAAAALGGLAAYLWFARYLPGEFATADLELQKLSSVGLVQKRAATVGSQAAGASMPPSPLSAAAVADLVGAGPTRTMVSRTEGEEKLDDQDFHAGSGPSIEERLRAAVATRYARMRSSPIRPEDWAKGMFGGRSTVQNAFGTRALTARVQETGRDWFDVVLTVQTSPPPESEAVFFLHNTFPNSTPTVGFDRDGTATLTIVSYGAFTVGVLTDDGTTELELDLAAQPDAPRLFRQR